MSSASSSREAENRELREFLLRRRERARRIPRRDTTEPAPLSFAQQRLWLLDRLGSGNQAYRIPFAFRLSGALDVDALARSIETIVDRHESLRTRFGMRGESPVQLPGEGAWPQLENQDLDDVEPAQRETALQARFRELSACTLDLERGPLLRMALVRVDTAHHVLLGVMHHIISDAGSITVFVKELAALYQANVGDGADPLPVLDIQYADFASWQRQRLEGGTLSSQLAYWREKLAGLPALEMLTDRPRPRRQGFSGRAERCVLDAGLSDTLRRFSASRGTTLFVTLLTAFAAVIHRSSAQDDLAVGTAVSSRDRKELEGLVGLFVNLLVLRLDVSGNPSLGSLLERVRQTVLEAFEHGEVPFEMLVRELEPDRDPARNPLAQVQFSMQSTRGSGAIEMRGISLDAIPEDVSTTRFDMECHVVDEAAGIAVHLIYNTDLFDAGMARSLLLRFERFLRALTTTPDCGVDEVSLLSDEECALQLETWVSTSTIYPRDDTVASLFSAKAFQRGDAPALEFGDRRMSYAELDAASDAVAMSLRARGVGRGDVVGVLLPRSVEMVVSWLGVLKADGVYLPLDPSYPAPRLGFMLSDSGARVLLVSEDVDVALEADVVPVLEVSEAMSCKAGSDGPVAVSGDALDAAYIVYTSGSTGEPKGVVVPHRGIVRLVCGTDYLQLDEHDRVAQVSNASFDAATFEVWGSLLNGGCLIGVEPRAVLDPVEFSALLSERRVTAMFVTTALFNQFSYLAPSGFNTLDALLFGGEAVDVEAVRRVKAAGGPRRLLHVYGPTESTTFSSWYEIGEVPEDAVTIPIGRAVANTRLYVLGARQELLPVGVEGELYIGGDGLALGYLNRDALTAERFVDLASLGGERVYRTGDRVRWRADGAVEFIGRTDNQVKVRGHRIEPGEVEVVLARHEAVKAAAVTSREDRPGERTLVGYVVGEASTTALKEYLRERLPEYMVPDALVILESLPLTENGKLDRAALPAPEAVQGLDEEYEAPRSKIEAVIAQAWCEVLGRERVGVHDNFFDLGGHSLLLMQVHAKLERALAHKLPMVALFEHPTVASLASAIHGERDEPHAASHAGELSEDEGDAIAIIAMTGRFPGAAGVDALWDHVSAGVESIRFFSEDELAAAGVPRTLIDDPGYVPARGSLDGVELFDAAYFGYTPREAELMDPQHRLFLECTAEALERGGYDPGRYPGAIGVFGGCGSSGYVFHLRSRPDLVADAGGVAMLVGNDKDFLTTRVSYKLNLRGPSLSVQTACSTSLVAVHEACRSLRDGECDMALAGGVSVNLPRVSGYTHVEHSILSRDGHCRAFDAEASGTVTGEGVAVVLLKRLADAVRDGDPIQAVVLGTAINNDGSDKVGYTAPSVRAQSRVVAAAQARACVAPRTIGYLEAHGTGTALGDPIEVAALNRVFVADAEESTRCAIGSIKSNIGHLDAAAGAAGLIKASLALKHRKLPPSVNFVQPNPEVDFAGGPFYVNAELKEWPQRDDAPRRAAVSSFGIGGTNAHAVLEEAPELAPSGHSRGVQLLPVSAMTEQALDEYCNRLADHLEQHPQAVLADVSYTLRRGRRELPLRRAVTCGDTAGAVAALRTPARARRAGDSGPPVVFLFPGQGTQYPDMGRALYDAEPAFRETVDHCCDALAPVLGLDLRTLLYRTPGDETDLSESLRRTRWTQPALFVTEYALARLWMSWGIQPAALVGHSVGEIVAACLAGVMSLDAALDLVAHRGRCMDDAPTGAMLAVPLAEAALRERLEPDTWVAAVNAPELSVAAGREEAIETLRCSLASQGVEARRLHTSHAFHCPLLDDAAVALEAVAARLPLGSPAIPYLSNVTGEWTSAADLEPGYWARQVRAPVQFSKCLERLLDDIPNCVLLEVGPGRTLASLARQQPGAREVRSFTSSLPGAGEEGDASVSMAAALADVWCAGATIDWDAYDAGQDRHCVLLPTYPYQRQRYWVEPAPTAAAAQRSVRKSADVGEWAYVPSWRRSAPLPRAAGGPGQRWLVIGYGAFTDALAAVLTRNSVDVSVTAEGELVDLPVPDVVVLAPDVYPHDGEEGEVQCDTAALAQLSRLARWLSGARAPVSLVLVQRATHDVLAGEPVRPVAAAMLGACRVLSQELAQVQWRAIDLPPEVGDAAGEAETVAREIGAGAGEEVVAYRGGRRWIQAFEPMPLVVPTDAEIRVRNGGTYLLTGGLGRIGTAIGVHLGEVAGANVVVTTRTLGGDDGLAPSKQRAIDRMEAAGARVLVLEADPTDGAALERAVNVALEHFGRIDGVIHAAGITAGEGFGPVAELGDSAWRDHLDVKLGAAIHLERILEGHEPDFMIAMGSLSGVLGGLGMGAYAAANAALAAYASASGETGSGRWCCIEWDGWRFDDGETDGALARLSMTPEEGLEVLRRVLSLQDVSRIVISTAGLDLRRSRASTRADETRDGPGERYQRPEMDGYVAPRSDTERALVDLWGRLLGVDPVGVEDNFLDLGGHSLLATQIISRVQQQFGVKVQLAELISGATIAHLAGIIDNARWAKDAAAEGAPEEEDQREVGEL